MYLLLQAGPSPNSKEQDRNIIALMQVGLDTITKLVETKEVVNIDVKSLRLKTGKYITARMKLT